MVCLGLGHNRLLISKGLTVESRYSGPGPSAQSGLGHWFLWCYRNNSSRDLPQRRELAVDNRSLSLLSGEVGAETILCSLFSSSVGEPGTGLTSSSLRPVTQQEAWHTMRTDPTVRWTNRASFKCVSGRVPSLDSCCISCFNGED